MRRPLVPAVLALTLFAGAIAPARAQSAPAAPAGAAVWKIDQSHSELTFEIRHLVSRVRGQFNSWSGNITADPADWTRGQVDVVIQTSSIDTNNERRDNHLRSADFFDAAGHPTITFVSRRVERTGDDLTVHGDLTIRGITRPVVLTGRPLGVVSDRNGKRRIGFEAETRINRLDYGVSWNRAAEGMALLGDDVKITIVVAAVEQ